MTKKHKISFNKRYLKDLQKIPRKDKKQIQKGIEALAENPRPHGCKKLQGSKNSLYRIRCGNYRVVYTIKDHILLVIVVEVAHRKNIYG